LKPKQLLYIFFWLTRNFAYYAVRKIHSDPFVSPLKFSLWYMADSR